MATIDLRKWSHAQTVINAATTAGSAPTTDSDIYITQDDNQVVSFVSGTGAGTLQLWVHDGDGWFKGDTFEVESGKTPLAVTWDVPSGRFTFQAAAVSGGDLTVKVL